MNNILLTEFFSLQTYRHRRFVHEHQCEKTRKKNCKVNLPKDERIVAGKCGKVERKLIYERIEGAELARFPRLGKGRKWRQIDGARR